MLRSSPLLHRLAAVATLLLQLALHTGIAVHDARAEGASVREPVHVEALGTLHAEHAHAPDCAISQHLQAHSAPLAALRPAAPAVVVALPRPERADGFARRAAEGEPPSRGPPAAA